MVPVGLNLWKLRLLTASTSEAITPMPSIDTISLRVASFSSWVSLAPNVSETRSPTPAGLQGCLAVNGTGSRLGDDISGARLDEKYRGEGDVRILEMVGAFTKVIESKHVVEAWTAIADKLQFRRELPAVDAVPRQESAWTHHSIEEGIRERVREVLIPAATEGPIAE